MVIILSLSSVIILFLYQIRNKQIKVIIQDGFSRNHPYSSLGNSGFLSGILLALFFLLPESLVHNIGNSIVAFFIVLPIVAVLLFTHFYSYVQLSDFLSDDGITGELMRADNKRERILIYLYHDFRSGDSRFHYMQSSEPAKMATQRIGHVCESCNTRLHLQYEWENIETPLGFNSWDQYSITILCEKCKIKKFEKYLSKTYFNGEYIKINELSEISFKQ